MGDLSLVDFRWAGVPNWMTLIVLFFDNYEKINSVCEYSKNMDGISYCDLVTLPISAMQINTFHFAIWAVGAEYEDDIDNDNTPDVELEFENDFVADDSACFVRKFSNTTLSALLLSLTTMESFVNIITTSAKTGVSNGANTITTTNNNRLNNR